MLLMLRKIGATLFRRPAETTPEPKLQDGDVVCPRCSGSGVDPIKNDPTNRCRNFLNADRTDSGVPVCRACGGYGTVPEDCLPWTEEFDALDSRSPAATSSAMLSAKQRNGTHAMGDEKSDGVLAFARRWLPIWENEVRQFRSGLKRTSEIRDGRIVDTTDEDLQLAIRKVGEMQELIDRHEAIHAQGT